MMRIACWLRPALLSMLLVLSGLSPALATMQSPSPQAHAGASAGTHAGTPFSLPRSEQRLVTSSHNGLEYLVMVAWPDQPPPASGYRVLYVLDANAMFLTAVDTLRSYLRRTDVGEDVRTVVVGIGYPPGSDIPARRTWDLTPVVDEPRAKSPTGGAEAFLAFIEDEVKPQIERDYRIDRKRQTLMGHSLAGMFTARALTRRPDAFESFIAISPSFWFGGHALSGEIETFARNRKPTDTPVRMLLMAGQYEEALRPTAWAEDPERAARADADLARRGQVTRARDAARHLATAPAMLVDFNEIAGEDHGSVIPAAIGRGVGFVLFGATTVPAVPTARAYFDMTADQRYRLRLQVRALPDPHRIPWLNQLKQTLHDGLTAAEIQTLHAERLAMDERYGSKPHLINADKH
jgi:predicted alpha/beta superfamily hydrolase